MRKLLSIIVVSIFLSNILFGQNRTYHKQEIIDDLTFLKRQLEENHPNINIYTRPEKFLDFFNNISIPNHIAEQEVYSIISSVNEVILDGHTLFYPNQNLLKHNNASGFFIPFQPYWDGEKLYIRKLFNQSKEIILGQEILSINGINSKELIQGMLKKMMRDGNNLQYPTWVLNNYFFEYYSYFYGCNKEYELVLKEKGKEKFVKVQGIPKAKLLQEINKSNHTDEKGISIELNLVSSIAKLTIKDWHNSKLKENYNQKFKREIKSIIKQIENNAIEHLIIDIRNNQGGDPKNSKYLLSYLLEDPFLLVESYKKKKRGKLVKARGPQMGIHKPLATTFKGKVYVLTNGGSFSNSGIFCSVLKKYKRAVFVGEETGGSEFVICGNPKTIQLLNTGITIESPRLQFLIKSSRNGEMHGVRPDFEIKPTIQNLIEGKDGVIEYIMKLIKENKSLLKAIE